MQTKKSMFKFDKSSHVSEDASLVKEHKGNPSDMSNDENLLLMTGGDGRRGEKILVCQPDPISIRKVYLPIMNYIHEIEVVIKCKPGQPCSLNAFLTNYIKDTFLAKGHNRNLQLTLKESRCMACNYHT